MSGGPRTPGIGLSKADAAGAYQPLADVDAGKARTLYAALADRANNPVDIVTMGDSQTEGRTATTTSNRWIEQFRDALRRRFQPVGVAGGLGYYPVAYAGGSLSSRWTLSGGLTYTAGGSPGLGRRSALLSASGHTATLVVPAGHTAVDLCWQGKGGTVSWAVDGGSATNIVTAADNADGTTRISGLSAAVPHTVVVTWVSGATGVALEGAMLYGGDETKGIRVWDAASSGAVTSTFTSTTNWAKAFARVNPAAVVLGIGTNDWATGVSSATTATNLAAIIAAIRANTTSNPTIILWAQYERGDVSSPAEPWSNYVAAVKAVAAADANTLYVDVNARMGSFYTDPLGLLNVDKIHPNDKGSRMLADIFARSIPPVDVSLGPYPTQVSVPVFGPKATVGAWAFAAQTGGLLAAQFLSSGTQNDSASYEVFLQAGTWTLELNHWRASSRGQYTLTLDGSALTALGGSRDTVEGYSASGLQQRDQVTGIVVPTTGVHTLTLAMATKNASSTSYFASPNVISFTKTA